MFSSLRQLPKKKTVAITYLWPYEEHAFLSDIHWTETECVGPGTYIFLHLEDKARLLHRVFVLYIPARNVWKFPLYYISFPLSIVRLKKIKKKKPTVSLLTYNCIKLWLFLVYLLLVKLSTPVNMSIKHVNFLFPEVLLYCLSHFCWVLSLYFIRFYVFISLGFMYCLSLY